MTTTPGVTQKRTVWVYDPTADENTSQEKLAPRLATLDGKTIGLLDNSKDLSDKLLDEVRALLLKDFPNAQFRTFRKDSAGAPAPTAIDSELATCDAVVTALGD